METTQLYYVTNRRHTRRSRWKPNGFGSEPSKDSTENLRFGIVKFAFDENAVTEYLTDEC